MKVKSLMISDPIAISRHASIREALEVMKSSRIRHLPVVSQDRTLRGFLTLADLKEGLLPSMIGDISLSDLIIKDPVTVAPEDDIETAARLIYQHKISGLLVVQDQKLAGILTETDILRTFIDMMGLLTAGSRIEVLIEESPEAFKKAVQIIQQGGGDIVNVSMTAQEADRRMYYFRLLSCRTAEIQEALEKEGFQVISARD